MPIASGQSFNILWSADLYHGHRQVLDHHDGIFLVRLLQLEPLDHLQIFAAKALLIATGQASSTSAPSSTTSLSTVTTTAITSVSGCHNHGATQFCLAGSYEYKVLTTASSGQELPSAYFDCHYHGTSLYCLTGDGGEVELVAEGASAEKSHADTGAATPASGITAVTSCHSHGTTQYCQVGSDRYQVVATSSGTEAPTSQYTGCHSHGEGELYCLTPNGSEVQLLAEGATASSEEESLSEDGINCHFHAGVEHCVGTGGEESTVVTCERKHRDYNIPLRIGLIFAILASGAIGSFGPIFLTSLTRINCNHVVFTILKQFGTGIIVSTAFVHLYTHATLMFENECLGELSYEATTSAIIMAGILLSFAIEYCSRRILTWRQSERAPAESEEGDLANKSQAREALATVRRRHHGFGSLKEADKLSVSVLEAGLIFHSVLIGVTLVVAGDSFFLTLFVVIFFHQMFEGVALGTRIAELPSSQASLILKMIMSACFTVSTPLGMAIGIGVLSSFNGNNPATIIAIGTLDAFSAGILVWVGVVEMWAEDWFHHDLANAGMVKTGLAFLALIAGMILMSLLGKWA
ncbi:hypothetical protein, variant [Verruconis gallopava]|uniref:Uncharacterized protein n=1 Tax=Verruconis gallopava TaxID=253628 RepID=A0A0D2B842_9PEZI|nr:hypothetical protein, variant [Verruconis gallopava]KIW07394.1 hypothetical protein, variant [Verruconis gallopava]